MTYTCPICKCKGIKHITLYGVKLFNECPICLSIDTYGESKSINDEELKLHALECGHILHVGCINSLISRSNIPNNVVSQIDIVSEREINIQHTTSERREDGVILSQRQRYQYLLSNLLHYNESADITDSYVFSVPFTYYDKICKWRRSYNNTIILYEDLTLNICITRGIRVHSPWPFNIEEHHRIDWNNITETRGYWTLILNYY